MEPRGQGIVTSVHARSCRVVDESDGRALTCHLRGRLFEDLKGETKPVAVGDRVLYRVTREGAAVEEILPRRNRLTRPAVRRREEIQTIAANIDRMVVTASFKDPPLRSGLVDRFLLSAGVEEIEAVICLNKIDLVSGEEEARRLREVTERYRGLGYAVHNTCARDGRGIPELREVMRAGLSLFVGHSGVGKSSIINRMDPRLRLKTGAINPKAGKGRHTTARVTLLRLEGGGFVVDTPGLRAFGIDRLTAADVGHYFPEMAARLHQCRFPTCTHRHEPGCAVLEAVQAGTIHPDRYKSYLGILEELEGSAGRKGR